MKKRLLVVVVTTLAFGCGEKKTEQKPEKSNEIGEKSALQKDQDASRLTGDLIKKGPVLLAAMSEFAVDDKGKYTVPDAAVMLVLQPGQQGWVFEEVREKQSNVFHKAMPYGKDGILTIGGNDAMLKMWKKKDGKWVFQTMWSPKFGGSHNRLRDLEIADFNGDGAEDLAIATHDQGVVAVVWRKGSEWAPEELDRKPDTFVHEIEVGDLDKNGKFEIYATPSRPNTISGENQGGTIERFSWDGNKFEKQEVAALKTRHVKEILVTDLDGDGQDELYASLEAETKGAEIVKPVEIRRYSIKDGAFKEDPVTSIDDRYCRFLTAGDIDGDGKKELVAAAFSSGVWVIKKSAAGYEKKCIDSQTGGFEHAAYITDLDGDGKEELFVADDRGGAIKQYIYIAGVYQPKVIYRRTIPSKAMVWNITKSIL